MKDNNDNINQLLNIIHLLNKTSRFPSTKNFIQHGNVSVYEHCIYVAYLSYQISDLFNLHIDRTSLIRGALLHDYFLYDWHIKKDHRRFHGFTHPKIALENATSDFNLTDKEKDIIVHHMFPLTPSLPSCKEAWIVCIADKICAIQETFGFDIYNNIPESIKNLQTLN